MRVIIGVTRVVFHYLRGGGAASNAEPTMAVLPDRAEMERRLRREFASVNDVLDTLINLPFICETFDRAGGQAGLAVGVPLNAARIAEKYIVTAMYFPSSSPSFCFLFNMRAQIVRVLLGKGALANEVAALVEKFFFARS